MSIPIDKLYHYIESIAREIYNDDIIIYRFYPHGSKKLEDLLPASERPPEIAYTSPQLYCYDQEPLNYAMYENHPDSPTIKFNKLYKNYGLCCADNNFKHYPTIYDKALLIHSERRSKNLNLYTESLFIPVYYWSHAIIALDWFRYAYYETVSKQKNINNIFLVYNRAWSGSREYRLKFIDLLITHGLINKCKTNINAVEPDLNIHYSKYVFNNPVWAPDHILEEYSLPTAAHSSASADYEIEDYITTDFEVVLETLFDDARIQLTEKILRPIALGQPFLLASTHGSLDYLRSYGFRTFASVFDESYDTIEDPVMRLERIVNTMKEIASWSDQERKEKMLLVNQIATYNRKHFFSGKFFNTVIDELRSNLKSSLVEMEETNTSSVFLNRRKQFGQYSEIVEKILSPTSRENSAKIVKAARSYYNRSITKK